MSKSLKPPGPAKFQIFAKEAAMPETLDQLSLTSEVMRQELPTEEAHSQTESAPQLHMA
jgi:hypothetical protein